MISKILQNLRSNHQTTQLKFTHTLCCHCKYSTLSYVSLYKLKILMTTEPFWFSSLLKIHLATQLVRLSPNLRRGRRVDDEDRTWHAGRQWLLPAASQTNKTEWQSTSCSWSYNSNFTTSHTPRFSPTPLNTLLALAWHQEILRMAFPSVGLFHQGNLYFMVAISLPASDWKCNRQALEMLFLALSSPHIHKTESIKPMGLYVSIN